MPVKHSYQSDASISELRGSTMSGIDENDPYDLQRFLDAQSPVFEQVRAELRAGQKEDIGFGSSSHKSKVWVTASQQTNSQFPAARKPKHI